MDPEKGLADQLDGLFSDIVPEAEEAETGQEGTSAEAISDLLEEVTTEAPSEAMPEVFLAAEAPAVTEAVPPVAPAAAAVEAVELAAEPATPALAEAAPAAEPPAAPVDEVPTPAPAELAPAPPPPTLAEAAPAAEPPAAPVDEVPAPAPAELAPAPPPPTLAEAAPAAEPPAAPVDEVPAPPPAELAPAPEAVKVPPTPVSSWYITLQKQRSKILNIMFGSLAGLATIIVAVMMTDLRPAVHWPYITAWALLVALALLWRMNPTLRASCLALLAYIAGTNAMIQEGIGSVGGVYLIAAPLLLSVLVNQRIGLIAAVVSSAIYVAGAVAQFYHITDPVGGPLNTEAGLLMLSLSFPMITGGVMFAQWMLNSFLTTTVNEAEEKRAELAQSQALLEERAKEMIRTNVLLEKRARQLQTANLVSHAAASTLDPDALMQQAVDLIREQLDLYYVGLFMTVEARHEVEATQVGEQMVLRAGTGEAGQRMLAQGHALTLGDDSLVGQCAALSEPRVAQASGEEPTSPEEPASGPDTPPLSPTPHPLLPDSHSQVALPLRSRGQVIGVLDAHSARPGAFLQEDIALLQTIADEIAGAVDNARLFSEIRQRLEEVEASQRLYVRQQWTELAPRQVAPFHERVRADIVPLSDLTPPEVQQAIARRATVSQADGDGGAGKAALVTPIMLRGEVIGALGLHETEETHEWTEDEIALVETVADQMALAIENVRLLEETRERAGWEQTLSEMTTRFTRSLDTDALLQTAVQELGQLLQVDEVSIHLGATEPTPPDEEENESERA